MQQKESGRTLLEMIGVLGMMGLLTVGAMSMYSSSITKLRLNDLLDEVRKRALVSHTRSSKLTYGMYDRQGTGRVSSVTSYGYGVADNKTGVVRDIVNAYSVAKVPVGAINGGHALDRGTCEALLRQVKPEYKEEIEAPTGAVIQVYDSKSCKNILTSCGSDDEEYPEPVPEIICIAIKS